ncbi:hypothetical protein R1flu_011487 [Riccia fluitans]|uniref:Uncharacterized protein n=1 Tax=Riccia fluitans TaxID=41844 RepID=A0ABD1Z857_9MARC
MVLLPSSATLLRHIVEESSPVFAGRIKGRIAVLWKSAAEAEAVGSSGANLDVEVSEEFRGGGRDGGSVLDWRQIVILRCLIDTLHVQSSIELHTVLKEGSDEIQVELEGLK